MSSGSVLLLTVLLMGYLYWSLAQPTSLIEIRCKLMRPVSDTSQCTYGAFLNPCTKWDCLKGPGENCGSSATEIVLFSKCADGLRCCNGRCIGCLNGKCYREPCHPPSTTRHYQLRSDPYVQERHMDPLYPLFGDYYSNE
uniref:Uncharacterized protein n=1 Tax=Anopheles dirus TaxID=7168 RepID=A0A182N047_9DIPT